MRTSSSLVNPISMSFKCSIVRSRPVGSCNARITFQLNALGTGLEVKQLDETHDHPPDEELQKKFKEGSAATPSTGALNKVCRQPVKVRFPSDSSQIIKKHIFECSTEQPMCIMMYESSSYRKCDP